MLFVIAGMILVNILITLLKKTPDISSKLKDIETAIIKFDSILEKSNVSIKDELQRNRIETNEISKTNREELDRSFKSFETRFSENIKELNDLLRQKFNDFASQQTEINKINTASVKDIRTVVEKQLRNIQEDNSKKLEEVRQTVDEKLQKTLNARLSQSFETVGKQLQAVQEGLGEMKNLASDVGGLKRF